MRRDALGLAQHSFSHSCCCSGGLALSVHVQRWNWTMPSLPNTMSGLLPSLRSPKVQVMRRRATLCVLKSFRILASLHNTTHAAAPMRATMRNAATSLFFASRDT